MKTYAQFVGLVLFAALVAGNPVVAQGQTFSNLYSFAATSGPTGTNKNGAYPSSGLTMGDNSLFGATAYGGTSGKGVVFKFDLASRSITNLHNFSALSGPNPGTNSDGAAPRGELVLSGNTLYGTVYEGGAFGYGAVFAVKTDGSSFTNLYSFSARTGASLTNFDGANPVAGMLLVGDTLYGTTSYGGHRGRGTLFGITTNGTGFTNLHSFAGGASDGGNPSSGLLLDGKTFYSTTPVGGVAGQGVVFAINTNGAGFTILHHFLGGADDGAQPSGGLALSGSMLFGATYSGGSADKGTVFRIQNDGTGYTNLHAFQDTTTNFPAMNSGGAGPQGELVISGNTLFGMAGSGGTFGYGVEFAMNLDGSGFHVLHDHTYNDGYFGGVGMLLSEETLYGSVFAGGVSGAGTLFSLQLPAANTPRLTVRQLGTNVVVSWPANGAGFVLQFTTDLGPSAAWSTTLPNPVIVNGQNTVTDACTDLRRFYRLRK
ncbi:MAG TPA: choice-of-anchor tandem repeat GloVer-containing protein [Verrucomicrobiae bacterium]|jgi:uncharacterized repeat protein (TIGR03803 family)